MKTTAMLINETVEAVTGSDSLEHLLARLDAADTPDAAAAAEKVHRIAQALPEMTFHGDNGTYWGPSIMPLGDALREVADLMAETTFALGEEQRAAEARLRR